MKYRMILLVTFLAMTALVCTQACSKAGTSSTASSTSKSDFVLETRLDVDKLDVSSTMKTNRLKIKRMNLDAGQLTFRLFTPAGDVHWEETFTAPASYKQTHNLEVIPGTWRLEIKTENATGEYDIHWEASNE